LSKSAGALGTGLGLAIVGWYGFDATLSVQTEDGAIAGLTLATAWIPASIMLLSCLAIVNIPLTAHRHSIVRRRLDSQEAIKAASNDIGVVSAPKSVIV